MEGKHNAIGGTSSSIHFFNKIIFSFLNCEKFDYNDFVDVKKKKLVDVKKNCFGSDRISGNAIVFLYFQRVCLDSHSFFFM